MSDPTPLFNLQAERHLLGGLLRAPHLVPQVRDVAGPDDFYWSANRAVCSAIYETHDRHGAVDLVLVAECIHQRKQTADVSYSYLAELYELEINGSACMRHAAVVRDRSLQRRLLRSATDVCSWAQEESGSVEHLLARAEAEILGVSRLGRSGESVPLSEALHEALERIDARRRGKRDLDGVPTRIEALDHQLGRLGNGELILLAARPSCGKTALALQLALSAADAGVPVCFASLEQSRAELAERVLSARGGVDSWRLRQGFLSGDEGQRLTEAAARLYRCPLFIDHAPSQTVLRVAGNARRVLQAGRGLVVVDYLQLIEPELPGRASTDERLGDVSRRLKILARELQVPVLALAQLNRDVERRGGRPRLSDLRGSGTLEQDADVVLFLHREDEPGARRVELIIAKQRNGPLGSVPLAYHGPTLTFREEQPDLPEVVE